MGIIVFVPLKNIKNIINFIIKNKNIKIRLFDEK